MGSRRLIMTPILCHCEAGEASRSNLVEGLLRVEIAMHLPDARNDIRSFSLVLPSNKNINRGRRDSFTPRNWVRTISEALAHSA